MPTSTRSSMSFPCIHDGVSKVGRCMALGAFALATCTAVITGCGSAKFDTGDGGILGGVIPGLLDGGVAVSVRYDMNLERFDTKAGTFEALPAPPTKRNLFQVAEAQGKVVVLGG